MGSHLANSHLSKVATPLSVDVLDVRGFPKSDLDVDVVVPGDMDVWVRLGQRPRRGPEPDDRAGPPALPPGFPLQNYQPPKKIATRLFHYQITTGAIYMARWWWRIMLY